MLRKNYCACLTAPLYTAFLVHFGKLLVFLSGVVLICRYCQYTESCKLLFPVMITVFRKCLYTYSTDSLMWLLNVVFFLFFFFVIFLSMKEQFGFPNGKDCFPWYNNTVAQLTENIFKTAHEKAGILWVIWLTRIIQQLGEINSCRKL